MRSRNCLIACVACLTVFAVLGIILGIVLSRKTISHSNKGEKELWKKKNEEVFGGLEMSGSGSGSEEDEMDTTDPTQENYTMTALAIGDWGRTVAKVGGSCCARRKTYTIKDFNAMEYTATLLGLAAAKVKPRPTFILGHGDNFYWTGLNGVQDQAYRFHETFETKYNDASLDGIPWINVLGNHDYGGASFVCAKDSAPVKCTSPQALVSALKSKFDLQASYHSPNGDRWVLRDHFYTVRYASEAFDVEIFNMDTNDADTHGLRQICCQCYGYSGKNDGRCEQVVRGDALCAGGSTAMYDACATQLKAWADDSRARLVDAVAASNATWKIINTHYSPYNHYSPEKAEQWKKLLSTFKGKVQLFIYGHTHAEKHDYASFRMHFIENGAGGGIQNESPSGIPPYAESYVENVWSAGHYPYGIFQLELSKTWMKVQFFTFDTSWKMNLDVGKTVTGGIAAPHCWYLPVSGRKGRACSKVE
ncbi:hypothetical protein ABG067_002130 [Albugo candida]